MEDNNEMLPITEAAETLKTTPLNVLMHIKRGLLAGTEEEGKWMINRASLDALVEATGGGKAADICTSGCVKKHSCAGCS